MSVRASKKSQKGGNTKMRGSNNHKGNSKFKNKPNNGPTGGKKQHTSHPDDFSDDDSVHKSGKYDPEAKAYKRDMKDDFIDEEIDDDIAFDDDDEERWGDFFASQKSKKPAKETKAPKAKAPAGKAKQTKAVSSDDDDDDDEMDDASDFSDEGNFTDEEFPTMSLSDMLDEPKPKTAAPTKAKPVKKAKSHVVDDSDFSDSEIDDSYNVRSDGKSSTQVQNELIDLLKQLDEDDKRKKLGEVPTEKKAISKRHGELIGYDEQMSIGAKESEFTLPSIDDEDDNVSSLFASVSSNTGSKISIESLMSALSSNSMNKKNQDASDDDEFSIKSDDEFEVDLSDDEYSLPKAAPVKVSEVSSIIGKMSRDKAAKVLAAPLSDIKQERIDRSVAHQATTELVSRWDDVIRTNREAPQLSFPLNQPGRVHISSASLHSEFSAANELEQDLEQLIKSYGFSDHEIRQREQTLLKESNITAQDLHEKEAKLRRMRALMFHQEQKQKHISKIKSKTYRKIKRKEAARNKLSIEELEAIDPELAEKERIKQELSRARERASLTHKTTSKWAKQQLRQKGHVSDATKDALKEQMRLSAELKKKMNKMEGVDSSDEEQNDDNMFYQNSGSDSDSSDVGSEAEYTKAMNDFQSLRSEYGLDGEKEDDVSSFDIGLGTEGSSAIAAKLQQKKSENKGLFSLAFMQRAMTAQREATKKMLEEMDAEMNTMGDSSDEEKPKAAPKPVEVSTRGGKKQFGGEAATTQSFQDLAASAAAAENLKHTIVRGPQANKSQANVKPLAVATGAFAGGLFDVDLSQISAVDEPQNDTLKNAQTKIASALELAQKAGVTSEDASKKSVKFTDNLLKDLPSQKQANVLAATAPVQSNEDVISDVSDSDDDDEVNPWARGTNTTAKKDVEKRASSKENASKGGKFKFSSEQAGAEKARSGAGTLSTSLGIDGVENATDVVLDMETPILATTRLTTNIGIDDEDFDGEDRGNDVNLLEQDKQAKLVAMAFSNGGDEEAAFQKLKNEEIENELPQEDPFAGGLPGWGAWGGAKVHKSKKQLAKEEAKRNAHKSEVEAKRAAILNSRADSRLKNVIINEQVDKKALKYQMTTIPNAYASRDQYERALRVPLGPDWNTQASFRKINAPSVVIKQGMEIKPITWTKSMQTNHKKKQAEPTINKRGHGTGLEAALIKKAKLN